ncbi:5-oxoprolinase subunit PxpA [Flavobacteriaceae bacterium 14752]|uniref:5-oxoprolinase subunit PxpA n=1 Tax=Mesohalobacter salilacus TaxID=2491711 RepID=UPI000F62CD10|nr:5-oxoprolinase subunit PxpA [Flavobacteriaceae bacterium 14752]
MNKSIDLNADLGEGKANDEALLKYVSSFNIACGGHAGNRSSIVKTIQLAQKYEVKIGAHPSYPDTKNFGRKSLNMSIDDLVEAIDSQLLLFKQCISETKAVWNHIKFHGALYNDLKTDTSKAKALVDLIQKKYPNITLYVPPNSVVQTIAESRIPIKIEGFADRAYNEDLSLVSRQKSNAVLTSDTEVVNQVKKMIIEEVVEVANSQIKPIKVETICIHGDTPKALKMLKTLVAELKRQKIKIQ